jgi:HEAT repeat protein
LHDSSPAVRQNALAALDQIGCELEPVTPQIVECLEDVEPTIRDRARLILAKIGRASEPAVVAALSRSNPEARRLGLLLLPHVGLSPEAVPIVRDCLKDADPRSRQAALAALVSVHEESSAEVVEALHDENLQVTAQAVEALARHLEDGESAIPRLAELLSRQPSLRLSALRALGAFGPRAAAALPQVEERLDDPESVVRIEAIQAWIRLRPERETAVSKLAKIAASDEDGVVRIAAAGAQFDLGAQPAEVLPPLIQLLHSPTLTEAEAAANTLGEISCEAAQSQVPALLIRLEAENLDSRRSAAAALAGLGSEARQAIPALCRALTDPDEIVIDHASRALGRLGREAKSAVPGLVARLRDKRYLRKSGGAVIEALGEMGADAQTAIPALVEIVGGANPMFSASGGCDHRDKVLVTLTKIGVATDDALSAVEAVLEDPSTVVRYAAIGTLGRLDPSSDNRAHLLGLRLKDVHPYIRARAALEFANLPILPNEAVKGLIEVLGDSDPYARTAAALALGAHGRTARPAVPALLGVAAHPNHSLLNKNRALEPWGGWSLPGLLAPLGEHTLRQAALDAVRQIDPAALECVALP